MEYDIWKGEDGEGSVQVTHDGTFYSATASNPKFNEIVQGLLDPETDDADVIALFDLAEAVANHFEPLSERVSIHDGRIYFDQEEINDDLTAHILRTLEGGADVTSYMPFVNFLEKVKTNPNPHSQEQLWTWVHARDFTITLEGDIIAYKGVESGPDYLSRTSGFAIVNGERIDGKIPNKVGSLIEMPRHSVVHNPRQGCEKGLHVATHKFAQDFSGVVLAVVVNPRDVVSVPTDANFEKMRVCRYLVKEIVSQPYITTIAPIPSRTVDPLLDDNGEEEESCPDCGCGEDDPADEIRPIPLPPATAPTAKANSQSPLDQEPTYKKLMGLLTNPGSSYKPFEVVDWLERVCGVITTKDSLRRFKQRHGLS